MLLESALADLSHLHDVSLSLNEYPASIPPEWDNIPGVTKPGSKAGVLGKIAKPAGRSGHFGTVPRSGELPRTHRVVDVGRSAKSGELGRKSYADLGRQSGELRRPPAPRLSKLKTAPANRSVESPSSQPTPARSRSGSASGSSSGSQRRSQHARSHARFQPNLETQNEMSENSEEGALDSEEDLYQDVDQEQDLGLVEVKKDVIVQSNNYPDAAANSEGKSRVTGSGNAKDDQKWMDGKHGNSEWEEEEEADSDGEKIELDLRVGTEMLTARLSKSGELGLSTGRGNNDKKIQPERTDSDTRRSGAVPFKWEQEPGVSKYKEEEGAFKTTIGGKTISLSGPLTPPPGAVAAAAAAARAALEKDSQAAKEKSITDKMRSILTGKFSGQLKPPLPPPTTAPAPADTRPVAKPKRVSFYETDVVVTFDTAEQHESSPVSILDRPESPSSPPYSPPHCPAPHGPSPASPINPDHANNASARRPANVAGAQIAKHLAKLTGMYAEQTDVHERDDSSIDEHDSDPDALWDAGDEFSEPSNHNSSNSRRVHPLPGGGGFGNMNKSQSTKKGAGKLRQRARADSWPSDSPAGQGQELEDFEGEEDLSDLEYDSQRMRSAGPSPGPGHGSGAPGKVNGPVMMEFGKPPLSNNRASSRQVSGELGLARPPGSRQVSGELGLMRPALGFTVPGILKTGGSRQVSGELGIHRPAATRIVSGELGLHKPTTSRPVSGELGRVQISTRPTTGSVPSSPERDEVFHSAPASRGDSRRNSGELDLSIRPGGSRNVDRYLSDNVDSDTEATPNSRRKVRNPFGSLKGDPIIKNGRIIYNGEDTYDDQSFNYEDRANEVVHSVDESLYAISPIASAFVFPGSAGSTPSASPQVSISHKHSSRSLTVERTAVSDTDEPRMVRSNTLSVGSTRHHVSNSFDMRGRDDAIAGSNIMNGASLLRRLSNVEADIDQPRKAAMNCAMACLPFRSFLGLKSSSSLSRRNSRVSSSRRKSHSRHSEEIDPFEYRPGDK